MNKSYAEFKKLFLFSSFISSRVIIQTSTFMLLLHILNERSSIINKNLTGSRDKYIMCKEMNLRKEIKSEKRL